LEIEQVKDQTAHQLTSIEEKLKMESEMRRLQEQEAERIRKENEAIQKNFKERDAQVQVLTNGLGWDVFQKVNLHKNEQQQQDLEKECSVCMEIMEKVCITEPCMHKMLCEDCYVTLKQKSCPICTTPITNFKIL